ncbi:hypothetical protein GCM10010174_79650 [Kutzneria viridogrisea]|uniref:Secreted protein n=1 Tax=Kutzneria viridogrisea TaxID=47990 RepID=A0ABR6BBV6_9PSEU|nr:hypothetical protein [Kutzneria viridogrisea]
MWISLLVPVLLMVLTLGLARVEERVLPQSSGAAPLDPVRHRGHKLPVGRCTCGGPVRRSAFPTANRRPAKANRRMCRCRQSRPVGCGVGPVGPTTALPLARSLDARARTHRSRERRVLVRPAG